MHVRFSRLLNGITLLALGGVLIGFCLNGRIDRYLHPQFRPWVLAGGIFFCVAAAIYLLTEKSTDCCLDGVCVHVNPRNPFRALTAFAVIALPLAAGTFFSKDSFDRQAVINRGFVEDPARLPVTTTTRSRDSLPAPSPALSTSQTAPPADESGEQYLPKGADGNIQLEVTDLLYGETQESLRKMFVGKTVEVVGQYLPGANPGDFKLVRMFIVCCAADARPVAIPVKSNTRIDAAVSDMSWVKLIGKATFNGEGEKAKVTFLADRVEPTDPPADAMLY